jgi:hypothetical protein
MIKAHISNNSKKPKSLKGTCYFGNSLFSKAHDGPSLEAIVHWVNSETQFDKIVVGLSDTLNRHTLQNEYSLTPLEAHEKCRALGDQWIARNIKTLHKLNKPFRFIRWDDWFANGIQDISFYNMFYTNLYNQDVILNSALNKDIFSFFKRRYNKSPLELPTYFIENSQKYLLEELAVYSRIFKEIGECSVIYPAKQLNMLKVIRNGDVQGIPNTIENSTHIKLSLIDNSVKSEPLAA